MKWRCEVISLAIGLTSFFGNPQTTTFAKLYNHSNKHVCPTISIDRTSEIEDELWTYTVQVEGVDQAVELTYQWEVSEGEIDVGQGTKTIKIKRPDLQKGIAVSVRVGGVPEGCGDQASMTSIS
jgi:hypothetical protein